MRCVQDSETPSFEGGMAVDSPRASSCLNQALGQGRRPTDDHQQQPSPLAPSPLTTHPSPLTPHISYPTLHPSSLIPHPSHPAIRLSSLAFLSSHP